MDLSGRVLLNPYNGATTNWWKYSLAHWFLGYQMETVQEAELFRSKMVKDLLDVTHKVKHHWPSRPLISVIFTVLEIVVWMPARYLN